MKVNNYKYFVHRSCTSHGYVRVILNLGLFTAFSLVITFHHHNTVCTLLLHLTLSKCINTTTTDVDECTLGQDNCDPSRAICNNTIGSFECECLHGFTGDGVTCEGQ